MNQFKAPRAKFFGCFLFVPGDLHNDLIKIKRNAPGLAMSHFWVICDSVPVLVYAQRA